MKMINIGDKQISEREAIVEAEVFLKPKVIALIKNKKIPKGDVLEAAKIAGILGAKKTPGLIPLCHPIPIEFADIEIFLKKKGIKIRAIVRARAKTGVEMEAFSAAAIAALTIYDMCKAFDREIEILNLRLVKKTGGASGIYIRK